MTNDMKYLLDSNIISDFYDKFSSGHSKISGKLTSLTDADRVYISILTLYELEYGWANAPDEKKEVIRQKIAEVQEDFEVLPLSAEGARLFGTFKKAIREVRTLSKENIKKHNIDMMIVATAVTEHCILVSNDPIYTELQPFHAELNLENWLI